MMYVLVGINVVVFVFEASLAEAGIERLFGQYAFIPARMSATPWSQMVWLTLFSREALTSELVGVSLLERQERRASFVGPLKDIVHRPGAE